MNPKFTLKIEKRNLRKEGAKKLALLNPEMHMKLDGFNLNLLPDRDYEIGTLMITGANIGIGHAFRVIAMDHLPRKILDIDLTDIISTDRFAEPYQIQHALNMIPIRQDIPEHAKFELNAVIPLEGAGFEAKTIYARELRSGIDFNDYILGDYPLTTIFTGYELHMKNIRIATGYGYQDGKFAFMRDVKYEIIDYVVVRELNKFGVLEMITVYWEDLLKLLNKPETDFKIKPKAEITRDWLYMNLNKIIVMKDKKYVDNMILPKEILKIAPAVVYGEIKRYQSTNYYPRDFLIRYKTYGDIPTKNQIEYLLDQIKLTVLAKLRKLIQAIKQYDPASVYLNISKEKEVTQYLIRGENQVLGNLLVYTIYDLYPDIKLVNFETEYNGNNSIIINLIHSDPNAILIATCEQLFNVFK